MLRKLCFVFVVAALLGWTGTRLDLRASAQLHDTLFTTSFGFGLVAFYLVLLAGVTRLAWDSRVGRGPLVLGWCAALAYVAVRAWTWHAVQQAMAEPESLGHLVAEPGAFAHLGYIQRIAGVLISGCLLVSMVDLVRGSGKGMGP